VGDRFEAGERVLLIDSRGRNYLITLSAGAAFHFHRGIVDHDHLIGAFDGARVTSTQGESLIALKPTLSEFVLKMPRGAQVVYPKDLAAILVQADIFPGARVIEAGAGSGALTIALLRAVGPDGYLTTYEVREDFAATARDNIEAFLGKVENLELKVADIYDGISEGEVDRVVLDLPEPWRAVAPAAEALREGGALAAYMPTVVQVQALAAALEDDIRWALVKTTETLVRSWHVRGRSVRPDHRMVAHTGFITTARRVAAD
jgi:tRNA (adenine57-N1/adenine58-N1)-methyltransferase